MHGITQNSSMKDLAQKTFCFLFGPLFSVINFFMRHYKANRERLDSFQAREKVSSFLQGAAVIMLLIWIVIFYFAPEEKRKELTLEIKQGFDKWSSPVEK